MTLDAGDEQSIHICLRVLDEVGRGLFSWDGYQRHSLVGGLEPNNLGTFYRCPARLVTTIALTLTTLCLLFLLGGSRGWTQEPQSARKELAWHPFYDSNDMTCELRFDIIGNPVK